MADRSSPIPLLETPLETARQAAELTAMRRMIEASQGCFSLSIAVCNSPELREYIIGRLEQSFHGVQVVVMPPGVDDPFRLAVAGTELSPPTAVMLVNLEASVPSDRQSHPAIRSLNAARERWEQTFACPIVLWVPEYIASILPTEAPDFWRYRSHRFEFVSDMVEVAKATLDQFFGNTHAAGGLSADEKRFRIAELEQRVADCGSEPPESLAPHVSAWLSELGFLYEYIGDLRRAEEMHRRSLTIEERLGRQSGVSAGYGNLGVIYAKLGDLTRAEEMFRRSLKINELLGERLGMAFQYGNLGMIYSKRGEFDRAEKMHRKSLEISKLLGQSVEAAGQYGNLGAIYATRGDFDRAEEMFRKALEMSRGAGWQEGVAGQLGSLGAICTSRGDLARAEELLRESLVIYDHLGLFEGKAVQYGNLGAIYATRGDFDRAEEMFRKSLEINELMGRQEGMARQYGNLGAIAARQGDLAKARELSLKSQDMFQRIGMPGGLAGIQESFDTLDMSKSL